MKPPPLSAVETKQERDHFALCKENDNTSLYYNHIVTLLDPTIYYDGCYKWQKKVFSKLGENKQPKI